MAEVKLKDAPQGVKSYCEKGIAAMERGNLSYAMDMFEAALGVEPQMLHIRKLLRATAVKKAKTTPSGRLAKIKISGALLRIPSITKKDPFQGLEATEKLLRTDPLNARIAHAQCEAAIAAGLPEIAIQTLEILKDNHPPSLSILEPLADLYAEAKNFESEYQCRNAISKLKPNDSAARKKQKDAAARMALNSGWNKATCEGKS